MNFRTEVYGKTQKKQKKTKEMKYVKKNKNAASVCL